MDPARSVVTLVWYGSHEMVRGSFLNLLVAYSLGLLPMIITNRLHVLRAHHGLWQGSLAGLVLTISL
jgi:hypothetical protein